MGLAPLATVQTLTYTQPLFALLRQWTLLLIGRFLLEVSVLTPLWSWLRLLGHMLSQNLLGDTPNTLPMFPLWVDSRARQIPPYLTTLVSMLYAYATTPSVPKMSRHPRPKLRVRCVTCSLPLPFPRPRTKRRICNTFTATNNIRTMSRSTTRIPHPRKKLGGLRKQAVPGGHKLGLTRRSNRRRQPRQAPGAFEARAETLPSLPFERTTLTAPVAIRVQLLGEIQHFLVKPLPPARMLRKAKMGGIEKSPTTPRMPLIRQ